MDEVLQHNCYQMELQSTKDLEYYIFVFIMFDFILSLIQKWNEANLAIFWETLVEQSC